MTPLARLVLLALAFSCTTQQPVTSSIPLATVPVRVAEYGATGALGDNASGTAYVYDDAITVVIREGRLMLTPKSGGREKLVSVSAALAYGDTASWNMRRESDRIRAGEIRGKGDALVDSLVFVIRGTRGLDLTQHWVMLYERASLEIPGRPERVEGTRPLHGDPRMFASFRTGQ
jgi:hypothetical protein